MPGRQGRTHPDCTKTSSRAGPSPETRETSLQAITSRTYGPPEVVQIEEIARPVPEDGQLLIRNYATVVSGAESTARNGKDFAARLYFGLARPRFPVLGTVFASEVQAVGSTVTRYRAGDQVMGSVGPALGAHAEYVTLAEDGIIAMKSVRLSWTDAAAILDGALTALPFLQSDRLHRGRLHGASPRIRRCL